MIELINKKKEEIDSLSPWKQWDELFLQKIKIDFTFHSNKLENNSLTYGQTIKFLKEIAEVVNKTNPEHPIKDYIDIENHYKLLDLVFKSYKNEFSVEDTLLMHKSLMENSAQWDYYSNFSPGKFKVFENGTTLSTGKIITYLQPDLVQEEMKKLIQKINNSNTNIDLRNIEKHPVTTATYFHNRFLEIHPFEDGNGRIARIITNQILIKNDFPPIFIKPVNREEYLKLFETSNSNDIDKMRNFFCNQLLESLEAKKQIILESLNASAEIKPKRKKGLGI